jgi:hypothetical protein
MSTSRALIAASVLALAGAMPAAAVTIYTTTLSGAAEFPPNASPGTGTAKVTVDTVASTMMVEVSFAGLLAGTTVAHIHCCTADHVAGTAPPATQTPTLAGFPAGVTAGNYSNTFDMTLGSSFAGPFLAANGGVPANAFAALVAGLDAGDAYFNIHSTQFAGGEIRGFLQAVPEPESYALMLAGLGALAWGARRRSR